MKENKKSKDLWLYGDHPVTAALQNPNRRILEIWTTKDISDAPKSIQIRRVNREQIDAIVGRDAVHQGIIARVLPLQSYTIDDLIRDTKKDEKGIVVILDQVTDPHNIGAVMRSSVAFGATAIILPDAGAPEESGTLAKSASGALEKIPLIRVSNLARAMEQLKKADYWCVGMDGYAKKSIVEQKLPSKCALVMGSEGDGMRRLTMENCDYLTKIPMARSSNEIMSDNKNDFAIESLNVSNACAITLYEWYRLYGQ